MKSVLVCGKWPLALYDGTGGYYHYVNDRADEVGRNAHCIRWLLEEVNLDIRSAIEPFGGVGVFATVIQGVCKPDIHRLYDIDDDCLRQLRTAFCNHSSVRVDYGDARETIGGHAADLYVIDFPSPYTLLHREKWDTQWKRLLEPRANRPRLVIWMDGASFMMHRHTDLYSRLSGYPVKNQEDYARAVSHVMHKQYGYSLAAATVSQGCYYFAAVPGPVRDFEVRRFTTKGCALQPVG